MRWALLWLALAGCGGPRSGTGRALDAYQEGRALLDAGEPLAAAERFATAAEADPAHPLLVSWQAWALAAGGETERAITVLQAAPGARLPEDLYDLGAWSARLGREDEAVAWITRAVAADPGLRARLVSDPDLVGLQARLSSLSELAEEPVRALMIGEEGAILAGESYDLELMLAGGAGRTIALGWDSPLPEGFSLRRVVDELERGQDATAPVRTLTWRVRAAVPGEGSLGPWTLRVGEGRLALAAVPWQVLLPQGMEPPPVGPMVPLDPIWWTPREALADLSAPAATWRHGALTVVYAAGDAVSLTPSLADPPLEIELRSDGQAELMARVWRLPEGALLPHVHIAHGGKVLLDAQVPRGR